MPWNDATSLLSSVATIDAMCTKGPSLPRGNPDPRVNVRPTILAMRVRNVKYSFNTTPLRMVFISGMPEPMACPFALQSDVRGTEREQLLERWADYQASSISNHRLTVGEHR